MDMRKCTACEKEFDFDKEGLQGPGTVVVCSTACAKKSSEDRGNKYVIHDKSGQITETNLKPGDHIKKHLW